MTVNARHYIEPIFEEPIFVSTHFHEVNHKPIGTFIENLFLKRKCYIFGFKSDSIDRRALKKCNSIESLHLQSALL